MYEGTALEIEKQTNYQWYMLRTKCAKDNRLVFRVVLKITIDLRIWSIRL